MWKILVVYLTGSAFNSDKASKLFMQSEINSLRKQKTFISNSFIIRRTGKNIGKQECSAENEVQEL